MPFVLSRLEIHIILNDADFDFGYKVEIHTWPGALVPYSCEKFRVRIPAWNSKLNQVLKASSGAS